MTKIAILDDYQRAALGLADWSRLQAQATITVFDRHLGDEAAVVAALEPFDVVVAMRERTRFPASAVNRLPRLRLIATTGMWNAAIDLAACAARGVQVSGSRGLRGSTADVAWGLILSLARQLRAEFAAWDRGQWQATMGIELEGKTLGLLGLGHLGSRMARIGQAFGMSVIAWSHNLTEEKAASQGVRRVDKDTLLAESDILSLHTVLSSRTEGIIGRAELARMKPTAFLINTSRGPLVDEAALAEALRAGRLGGAGLDTFSVEPLPVDHPFRSVPNIVMTPHLGYVTRESLALMYGDVVEVIEGFLDGRALREIKPLA
jgi:phosphoglycerate dehydrogenase-like enzyme